MFSKIVVGTDGSEAADRALLTACDIAKSNGAALHIIHVPQPETVAFAMGAVAGYHMVTTMPHDDEVDEAAQKVTDAATKKAMAAGIAAPEAHIAHGEAGDMTVALAEEIGADLIVTGRRGLGALAGLFAGSTSQRISRIAKCAVLTVP